MSAKLVGKALEQRGLSHSEKLTLIALADCTNSATGVCWPSMLWISNVIERSARQTRTIVRKLEERGFVSTSHRPGTSSTYVVFPDLADPGSTPEVQTSGTPEVQTSAEPEGTYRTEPSAAPDGHHWRPGGSGEGCGTCGRSLDDHTDEQEAISA